MGLAEGPIDQSESAIGPATPPVIDKALRRELMKLRAIIVVYAAEHGQKDVVARACVVNLRNEGCPGSLRSIQSWTVLYRGFGFAGLLRKRRSDFWTSRRIGSKLWLNLIDAAVRAGARGDVGREFRRLVPSCSFECFRFWLRRFQKQMRVRDISRRGGRVAFSSQARQFEPGRRPGIPTGTGVLPVPDPRTWPDYVRVWYRQATGAANPLQLFIFDHGPVAALYLQDAVSAAAILEIDPEEWRTERGYPVFCFDPSRISEIRRRLSAAGYRVSVLVPAERLQEREEHRPAKVLSIVAGREKTQEAQSK